MKNLLLAIMLMVVSTGAMAACDLSNVGSLDQSTVKALELECQKALDAADSAVVPGLELGDPEKLSAWGSVAQEWAKALGIAATELGLAADTFLETDAGKMTAAVIIYQVAGDTILGVIIGVPLLILIIVVTLKTAARARILETVYHETETNWRGKPKVIKQRLKDIDECGGWWIAHAAGIVMSVFTLSLVIFP